MGTTRKTKTQTEPDVLTDLRKAEEAAAAALAAAREELRQAEESAAHWTEQAERLRSGDPDDEDAARAYIDASRRAEMAQGRLPAARQAADACEWEWRCAHAELVRAAIHNDPDINGIAKAAIVRRTDERLAEIRAELVAEITRLRAAHRAAAERARGAWLPSRDGLVGPFGMSAEADGIIATANYVGLPGMPIRAHGTIEQEVQRILAGEATIDVADPYEPEFTAVLQPPVDDGLTEVDKRGGLNHYRDELPPGDRFSEPVTRGTADDGEPETYAERGGLHWRRDEPA